MLVGKTLYLREGYLDDSLSFNEHGVLVSRSAKGSYTLSGIEINKVRVVKRKVVLEGARYGLHFLGAMPYEDPSKAVDRVRITPKKKVVRITIDREAVVKPKKQKAPPRRKSSIAAAAVSGQAAAPAASPEVAAGIDPSSAAAPASAAVSALSQGAAPLQPAANSKSATAATSPAHSAALLREALDRIFAQGLDARMMAAMPDFWRLYYQAAAAKSDYRPADPAVLRQNAVDVKAHLVTNFEPGSNQFAQDNGVAGMALYHVVVGADGKPGEIAVARPIGFGLDENAVEAIRKASFEPATKNGKPVPVLLDLVVQFRIFSHRTAAAAAAQPQSEQQPTAAPSLPGPYSVQQSQ